ncbi:unnamed protein product [Sympodiomycopsis kandeliae]
MDHQNINATPQSASNRQNSNSSILPSPTSSESVASSNSHLCTPISSAGPGTHHSLLPGDFRALNAAFSLGSYGENMSRQDSDSLSSALNFGGPMTVESQSSEGKPVAGGHKRTDSATRRHSVQPILSNGASNLSLDALSQGIDTSFDYSSFMQAQGNGLPDDFDFMSTFTNEDQQSGADTFLSPPRLTVSLPAQSDQQARQNNKGADSPKRLRLAPESEGTAHMSRSAGQSPSMPPPPSLVLETPQRPSQVQHFFPGGHRDSDASTATPFSDKTASSLMDSLLGSGSSTASERSARRLSIDNQSGSPGRDRLAGQANMLGISGVAHSLYDYPAPPKSAPPNSSFNAMQQAQNAAQIELADRDAAKAGKGADVWPDDVEVAFWEALRLIPKLGRRKVLVNGKPCGRNELIADYIFRKTDKIRTRKQVSSHIQVLKNIKKDDLEFQSLIAEPVVEEDFYMPAGGMMYVQTLAGYGYGGLGGPDPMFTDSGNSGLLSPYSPFAGGRPLPPASPLGAPTDFNNPPPSAGGGITAAFGQMGIPSPRTATFGSASACPILPSTFTMCVSCSDAEELHYYTKLDYESMAPFSQADAQLPRIPLDTPRLGSYRFPRLSEMFQRLPCQFLHVTVPMAIPRQDILLPKFDRFTTQLSLTSHSDRQLTSITTVYSFGKKILSLYEALDAPRPIAAVRQGRKSGGETPTPRSPGFQASGQPSQDGDKITPKVEASDDGLTANGGSSQSLKHLWSHQAPFATDFWADFLSRQHPVQWNSGPNSRQAFCKEPSERAALGMAVGGVTIIQELVVANNQRPGSEMTNGHGVLSENAHTPAHISPGSYVGDVVLVIAWDLECVEKLGTQPGRPTVSHICEPMHRNVSPMMGGQQRLAVPPQQQFAGYSMSSPTTNRTQLAPSSMGSHTMPLSPLMQGPPQLAFNGATSSSSGGPSLLRKRGLSGAKPNLMLNIPPAAAHLNPNRTMDASPRSAQPSPNALAWGAMQRHAMMGVNTPITPATGMGGTPLAPPPLPTDEESKAHRERLTRAWAANAANGGHQDFNSPLVSTFQLAQQGGEEDDMVAAARKFAFNYPHANQQHQHQHQHHQQQQQQHSGLRGSLGLSFDADQGVAGGGLPPHVSLPMGMGNQNTVSAPDAETKEFIDELLRNIGVGSTTQ